MRIKNIQKIKIKFRIKVEKLKKKGNVEKKKVIKVNKNKVTENEKIEKTTKLLDRCSENLIDLYIPMPSVRCRRAGILLDKEYVDF